MELVELLEVGYDGGGFLCVENEELEIGVVEVVGDVVIDVDDVEDLVVFFYWNGYFGVDFGVDGNVV